MRSQPFAERPEMLAAGAFREKPKAEPDALGSKPGLPDPLANGVARRRCDLALPRQAAGRLTGTALWPGQAVAGHRSGRLDASAARRISIDFNGVLADTGGQPSQPLCSGGRSSP